MLITRRQLMQYGMAAGATRLARGASQGNSNQPLFRFAQINDLHVQSDDANASSTKPQSYARANEKARWLVEAINRKTFGQVPDFVVGVGHLIHGENLDRFGPDLKTLKNILKPLSCPFYPVVGNHEVKQQERSQKHLAAYVAAFGEDRVEYTFAKHGLLFVALNNSGAASAQAPKERTEWLRDILDKNRNRPKIILCHIPLIPLRDKATLAKSFGFPSYHDRDPDMLSLVEKHADTIIAVLSGHLHLTAMKMHNSVCHLSLSGTANYPSDGLAVFDVFADRIEATVHQLPKELANSVPSIHGKPRYKLDYTDKEHPTAEDYQRGLPGERRFTIPLSKAKRLKT